MARARSSLATTLGSIAGLAFVALVMLVTTGHGDLLDPGGAGSSASPSSSVIPVGQAGCVSADRLPPQAEDTLSLIQDGGPFPYEEDGTVFGNYEGHLPAHPRGYYHEYTVITPGEDDRGARRIIAAADGSDYYTADHYASFTPICGS